MTGCGTLSTYWYEAIYDVLHDVGLEFGYDARMCVLRSDYAGRTISERNVYWIDGGDAKEIQGEFLESLMRNGIDAAAKKFGTGWIIDIVDFDSIAIESARENDEFDVGEWKTVIQKGKA